MSFAQNIETEVCECTLFFGMLTGMWLHLLS